MKMEPVSKPIGLEAESAALLKMAEAAGTTNPLPEPYTWTSKGPGAANIAPMGCGTRYKDRMALLRQSRPRFRNILLLLKYIVSACSIPTTTRQLCVDTPSVFFQPSLRNRIRH